MLSCTRLSIWENEKGSRSRFCPLTAEAGLIPTNSIARFAMTRSWFQSWPQIMKPECSSGWKSWPTFARNAVSCCTATWCSRLEKSRRDWGKAIWRRQVSPRTNFTDRREPGCFTCAPVCRSRPSSSAAPMRISAGPEPKMYRRSQEWRRRRIGCCAIAPASRNGKRRCATGCGITLPLHFLLPPKTATPRTVSQIRST